MEWGTWNAGHGRQSKCPALSTLSPLSALSAALFIVPSLPRRRFVPALSSGSLDTGQPKSRYRQARTAPVPGPAQRGHHECHCRTEDGERGEQPPQVLYLVTFLDRLFPER